jgi:hypothetical protein
MTAPKTRNWSANELPDFAGHRYHLKVHGEVETSATNYSPKLTEHIPQGINPRILLLDLTIVKTAEVGGQVVAFRSADYDRPTNGHQYDEVDILFEGNIIERIKVSHPKTAAAAAPKKPAASNAAKKGGKKKPAKKKPAKKKPAKKKPAEKKGAKKAAKKSPKKKSAKKTKARSKK